jgi:glycerate-2-kinase
MYIQNRNELVSHGYKKGREAVIDIIEHALQAVDPYRATRELVHLEGSILSVGYLNFDLSKRGDIYLLGMGKATFPIAKAMEEILAERITEGLIIVKEGQKGDLKGVKVREASHPLPDSRGLEAAKEMKAIAERTQEGDIVFCAITGGSSALAPLPVPGVSLEEKRKIHELLLRSGATIREINAVRKHLSDIKGGKLALSIFPAEIINLTVSDVTEDPLDYITGPTVPDTSTFEDAILVLEKYDLLWRVPGSALDYLQKATPEMENPKSFGNMPVHTFVLVKSGTICKAASNRAQELGFASMILTLTLEGESREAGIAFARIGAEIQRCSKPLTPPCVVVAGGETTVTIHGQCGEGGPNQEFALSAALQLDDEKIVIAAIDSDGTDGPTDIAGGIVDASTAERAKEKDIDISRHLLHHNASPVLRELNDAVITGHTGTNVNDLKILLVD